MPLIGTRGAASARGFGLYGLRLVTVTFPAGTSSWTSPSGVTKIQTAIGKGADGTPAVWNNVTIGYAFPNSALGSSGSILDWSTVYSDANALLSTANAGGTGDRLITAEYYIWPLYSDNTAGARTTLSYPNTRIRNTAALVPVPSGTPTSGQVLYGSGYLYWAVVCDKYFDATTGANTTAFSLSFPGGVGGAATTTTYNNVTISPSTTYTIVNNQSLTITYYA
jgi:hypothetical protein